MRSQLHIAMLDEFGDEVFLNSKRIIQQTFDQYRQLRKQVITIQEESRRK